MEKIIITAMGANKVGVVAGITTLIAKNNINIHDMSQRIVDNLFTLIIIADFSDSVHDFNIIKDQFEELAKQLGIKIFTQHENVFKYMHRL